MLPFSIQLSLISTVRINYPSFAFLRHSVYMPLLRHLPLDVTSNNTYFPLINREAHEKKTVCTAYSFCGCLDRSIDFGT